MNTTTLPMVLKKLGMCLQNDVIAELVLWAIENKDNEVSLADFSFSNPGGLFPSTNTLDINIDLGKQRVLTWKERCAMYEMMKENKQVTPLPFTTPKKKKSAAHYDGIAQTLQQLQETSSSSSSYRLAI
jgi:hypothetical protein